MSLDTITINTPVNTPAPTVAASKRDAILAYRTANPGASVKQITDALGVNLQYAYNVLKEAKRGPKVKRKLGRPRKVKSPLEAPQTKEKGSISYHEYDALRSELMQATHLAEERRQEIEELTIIIAYLEHRCARAEGSRGPAI
jgi:transposase